MKIILYIATSLDGFIADENGGIDWLPHPENDELDEFGYKKLLNSISTIIMGSKSYEQILTFGDWEWKDKQTYVFTTRELSTSKNNVDFIQKSPKEFIDDLKKKELNQNIWLLGGAELIYSFAIEQLIDECIITLIPKTLKSGIKLELAFDDFVLTNTKECSMGIVQNFYIKDKH